MCAACVCEWIRSSALIAYLEEGSGTDTWKDFSLTYKCNGYSTDIEA